MTTTPVRSTEALLDRAWDVHKRIEQTITEHALRLIAQRVKEALPNTYKLVLSWEESPYWEIHTDDDDEGLHKHDAYDVDEGELADWLHDHTAHFWETSPHRLNPYTESGSTSTDKTFGMLDEATFLIERLLAGPRPEEEQRALEQAAYEHALTVRT